ncbi:MAG: lysine-2,3-aminomutase-like protein, partial [Caulobacteraceae bacterium]|nr:lysine-2,3-aminomutase-like protein [Caulobacter sp.]
MPVLTRAAQIAAAGLVEASRIPDLERVAARYAVAITPDIAGLIDPADAEDPIARQFLPDPRELDAHPLDRTDPIGDAAHTPVKGIVHRYPDRVLLKPTHACAVYCRFCFRREVVGPGGEGALTAAELDAAFEYIATHPEVWEVILTGGDPLTLSPRRLADLSRRLAAVEPVKVLRVHTRVPVVAPERVTSELVEALRASGKAVWVAVHANHARELSPAARAACAHLVDAGVPLVSQTVLLRGVNDTPGALEALMRAFVECRIKPYYLHHGDLAPGTAHLRTEVEAGRALVG